MDNRYIPCCMACGFFENEDADGWGFCVIRQHSGHRSDQCELDHTKMKPNEIAKALHVIQKWRRGSKDKMPLPYVIGKAIDAAIYQLRK